MVRMPSRVVNRAGGSAVMVLSALLFAACRSTVQAPEPLLQPTATAYVIQELEVLPGFTSAPVALSTDGNVLVGTAQNSAGQTRAVTWNHAGEITELAGLGGASSSASAVSADGSVIVGTAQNSAGQQRAVKWNQAGEITELPTLGGVASSASLISADGNVIAGITETTSGQRVGVLWQGSGEITELAWNSEYPPVITLGAINTDGSVVVGEHYIDVYRQELVKWNSRGDEIALNHRGGSEVVGDLSDDGSVIVGYYLGRGGTGSALKWNSAGEVSILPGLGARVARANSVSADGSVAVGYSENYEEQRQAVKWNGSGEVTELSSLGGTYGSAADISADGSVAVGYSTDAAGQRRAVTWDSSGQIADLGTLGGASSTANLISADGSVVAGSADNSAGERRSVIWLRQTTPDSYTISFDGLPLNKVIYELSLGKGIISDSGSSQDKVYLQAKRQGLRGNVAVVTGTDPALIISKNGRSGSSFPQGGTINLEFGAFGDGLVDLKTLEVSGTTNNQGSVAVYRNGSRLAWVRIPHTGPSGSKQIRLSVSRADQLIVKLQGPGRIDDVVFRD